MEMEVLRLENLERRVLDQNILLTALRLGRDASLGLKEVKRVLHNESLSLSSRSEQDLLPLLYRTAMSTSSDSSSDCTTGSSRAAPSTTASSIISTNSSRSTFSKLRNRLKRLSYSTKRRTQDEKSTSLSLPNRSLKTIDNGSDSCASSAHSISSPVTPFQPLRSLSLPPPLTSDFPIYSLGRFSCAFESYPYFSVEEDKSPELALAKERSRLNPYLQSQRDKAFEEQSNLLQEYYVKRRALSSARDISRRKIISLHAAREVSLKASHVAALSELEPKHLNAEQELENDLATEQRNLDIRIKHMKGYCSGHGSSSPEGTLKRKVTKSDRMSLEQQQHVREGMDDLHKARINVLRARQAKQLERMMAKQGTELADLHLEHEKLLKEDEDDFQEREQDLKQEMMAKKQCLSKRWIFEEAFARWRLEEETGLKHGPLPNIEWSEDEDGLGSWRGVSVFNEEDDSDEISYLFSDQPEARNLKLQVESIPTSIEMS